ncbi:MAG: hypothetical protein HKM98_05580, partial [Gammaproteobacteria bacterium]|nr:hypothetical protein [Gammaproteobacteria bacterium]
MLFLRTILLVSCGLFVFSACSPNETEKAADKDADKKSEEKIKSIAEVTENSERIDGLFTLYRDNKDGSVY